MRISHVLATVVAFLTCTFALNRPLLEKRCECDNGRGCSEMWPDSCYCENNQKLECWYLCGGEEPILQVDLKGTRLPHRRSKANDIKQCPPHSTTNSTLTTSRSIVERTAEVAITPTSTQIKPPSKRVIDCLKDATTSTLTITRKALCTPGDIHCPKPPSATKSKFQTHPFHFPSNEQKKQARQQARSIGSPCHGRTETCDVGLICQRGTCKPRMSFFAGASKIEDLNIVLKRQDGADCHTLSAPCADGFYCLHDPTASCTRDAVGFCDFPGKCYPSTSPQIPPPIKSCSVTQPYTDEEWQCENSQCEPVGAPSTRFAPACPCSAGFICLSSATCWPESACLCAGAGGVASSGHVVCPEDQCGPTTEILKYRLDGMDITTPACNDDGKACPDGLVCAKSFDQERVLDFHAPMNLVCQADGDRRCLAMCVRGLDDKCDCDWLIGEFKIKA